MLRILDKKKNKNIYLLISILVLLLSTGCEQDDSKNKGKIEAENIQLEENKSSVDSTEEIEKNENVLEEQKEDLGEENLNLMKSDQKESLVDKYYAAIDKHEVAIISYADLASKFINDERSASNMYMDSLVYLKRCVVEDLEGDMVFLKATEPSYNVDISVVVEEGLEFIEVGDVIELVGKVTEYEYHILIIEDVVIMHIN